MTGGASEFTTQEDFTGVPRALPISVAASPTALAIALTGGVGVGKTDAFIDKIVNCTTSDPQAVVIVSVADHAMADEIVARLRARMPGVQIEKYLGTAQPDPTSPPGTTQQMCPRGPDMKAVQDQGWKNTVLCGSKKYGPCPLHGTCGYQRQQAQLKTARVVVITHAMLSRGAPPGLERNAARGASMPAADFLVIDEAFHPFMVREPVILKLSEIDPASLSPVPDNGGIPGLDNQTTHAVLAILYKLVMASLRGDRLTRAKLLAVGLTAPKARAVRAFVLRLKKAPPSAQIASSPGAVAKILRAAAFDNKRVLRLARLLEVVAEVLDGRLGGAALRIGEAARSGAKVIAARWREEIHADWADAKYGIIHADATMQDEIVRVFIPGLSITRAPPIAAPHMHVTQVADKPLGNRKFIPGSKSSDHGKRAATTSRKKLLRFIVALSRKYDGKGAPGGPDVLIVLFKGLETELLALLPANVATLHFGKLRGQDAYKGVAALAVVSRMLPPPSAMEDTAEIIFGRDVTRLPAGEFYPTRPAARAMADGTVRSAEATFHPDPAVEAVRWSKSEAELIQAVGRGRGVRRTAANPLDVFVLTNVPMEGVLVNEVTTWDELMLELAGPVREMEQAGILPHDWRGRAAVLAGLGLAKAAGGAWREDALRQWFRDNPTEEKRLHKAMAGAQGKPRIAVFSPVSNISTGENTGIRTALAPTAVAQPVPGAWLSFRYRLPSVRKAGRVLVSPMHPDPRAAVEALMGRLDHFEPDKAAAPPRAPRRKPTPARAVATPEATAAPPPPPATPPIPSAEDELAARLDAVPIGLPALMTALEAGAWITPAARRRHMDRFRMARGSHAEREHQALTQLAAEVGPAALQRAARAAAARALGLPHSGFAPSPSQTTARATAP